MIKRLIITAAITSSLMFSGCVTIWESQSPFVRIPGRVGADIGMVAGLPLCICALPITIPLSNKQESPELAWAALQSPSIICAWVTGTACALPGYLLFGWWEDEPEKMPSAPQPNTMYDYPTRPIYPTYQEPRQFPNHMNKNKTLYDHSPPEIP